MTTGRPMSLSIPADSLARDSPSSSPIREGYQELRHNWRHRASVSEAADVVVRVASSYIAYRRNRNPGGVGQHLVSMSGVSAATAVPGYPPLGQVSEDDRHGARIFLRQLSTFIAQDQSNRSSLSFSEHGEAGNVNINDPASHPREHHDSPTFQGYDADFGTDSESTYFDASDAETLLQSDQEQFESLIREADQISIGSGYSDQQLLQNIVNISVYSRNQGPLEMRALLDTGTELNLMREERAIATGHTVHPLQPLARSVLICANGQGMHPLGFVTLTWYFNEQFATTRSYDVSFLVVSDASPYDVILGFKFLQRARIFRWHEAFAAVLVGPDQRDRERRQADEAARRRRDQERAQQRARDEERRRRERERREQERRRREQQR